MGDLAAHVVSLIANTAEESAAAFANLHSEAPAILAAATTAATAAAMSSASSAAALPELSRVAAVTELLAGAPRANMLQLVTAAAAEALASSGQDAESPPLQEPLMEVGLNSAAAVQLVALLEAATGLELPGTLVFDYPTIAEITDHLLSLQPEGEALSSQGNTTSLLQGNLTPSHAAALDGSQTAPAAAAAAAVARSDILTVVFAAVTDVLNLTRAEAEELSLDSPLMDAGLTSASAIQLTGALEEALDTDLPGTLIFDYPTIASLVSHLATCNIKLPTCSAAVPLAPMSTASAATTSRASADAAAVAVNSLAGQAARTAQVPKQVLSATANHASKAIAIVSSSHRVPGGVLQPQASTLPIDRVTPVPLDRWDSNQAPLDNMSELNAAFGAFVQGADEFDSAAFHLSAAEATLIDPQQRLLLETFAEAQSAFTHWDSLSDQNAGQYASSSSNSSSNSSSSSLKQRFGVYVGVSQLEYARITYETGSNLNAYYATGAHLSVTSGRIAYTFGLKGPAMAGVPSIKAPVPVPVPVRSDLLCLLPYRPPKLRMHACHSCYVSSEPG